MEVATYSRGSSPHDGQEAQRKVMQELGKSSCKLQRHTYITLVPVDRATL